MRAEAVRRRDAAQEGTRGGDQELAARLQRAIGPGFRVLRELGGGGMSRLFLAEQLAPHRLVVAKVLADPGADALDHHRHEAALTASLRHPHVLPVLAAGEGEGIAYFVTPYVTGGTLRDRLESGVALSQAEVRRTLREIAAALAHVHARGVVHGDVKPENVLLQHGRAVLADFGAARPVRPVAPGADLTPRPAAGTPLYMSPEQAAGDPFVGPRSDVYSFGVLAFELLTGRTPFQGRTPRALLLAHLGEPAPCLVRIRPDLPPELVEVVARALAKDPAERHADGAALLAALQRSRFSLHPTVTHAHDGVRAVSNAPAWRQRAAAMMGAVAATAGGLGISALGLAGAAMLMLQVAPSSPAAPELARPFRGATVVTAPPARVPVVPIVPAIVPAMPIVPAIVADDERRHDPATCASTQPRRILPAVVVRAHRSA